MTETNVLFHVMTENGTVIDTTENHPFYVEGKGWCAAVELEDGDVLRTQGGETEIVEDVQIEQLSEAVKVYNLEIEDSHTYYVSADEVLVHNICGKPDSKTQIDMDEVMSGHTVDGNRAKQSGKKDLFNENLSEKQILKMIKDSIKNAKKVSGPQFDGEYTRYKLQGKSGKQVIEMWYNVTKNIIETAYPIYGKKVKIK